jgi:hypothetical protein
VAIAACAITSLALVTASAQAQTGHRAASSFGARPNLVKHKGGKTYLYCGSMIGCTGEFVVYSKLGTFEFSDEAGVTESGVIEKVKMGKKKSLIFRTTSEYDDGCIETAVKTSTGLNSESAPGNFECPFGEDGEYELEETWYGVK